MRGGDGRAGVKRMRGVGGRLEEIVEGARCGLGVMIDRGQQAVAVGADAKPLAGGRAMADRAVHLFAAQHELDRPADQSSRHDAEDLRPGDQALGAEAAAEEGAADMNLLRGDAEQSRDPPLGHGEALARRIDRQRVAVPRRHDGVRLHGVVVLGGRLVGRIDALRCRRETRLDIAAPHFGRIADADGGRHEAFAGIETDAGGLRFVARRQQRCAFRRGLQRLGDHHRDRLVRIAHLVVLQEIEPEHEGVGLGVRILRERRPVGGGHDLDDARVALGGLHVEEGHATARDAADRQNRMEHAGRVVIRGIAGFALDLQHAVAAGQRLADIRAVPEMGGSLGEAGSQASCSAPGMDEKGEAGRAGTRSGVPAAASVRARTRIRRASSILN